jgi:hypothetical protein
VKAIEACMKLYNNKDHHTNGNTGSQPGDIDNSVIPVTAQISECSFEIFSKHKQAVLDTKPPKEYRFEIIDDYQLVGKWYT